MTQQILPNAIATQPNWASASGTDENGAWSEFTIANITQRLRWIPPGQFLMGSPESEPYRFDDEDPMHAVLITQGFWLADSACTQALWMALSGGDNPSRFQLDLNNPVEQVSWDDVQAFLLRLQAQLPDGAGPVLPSEAQWEYACRAGSSTPFSFGENISPEQVNYDGDSPYDGAPMGEFRRCPMPVKSLPCNRWGLYEMHGNVWEWCADGLREYSALPSGEVARDPLGSTQSPVRALRGGSWFNGAEFARAAARYARNSDERHGIIGFRLALRA